MSGLLSHFFFIYFLSSKLVTNVFWTPYQYTLESVPLSLFGAHLYWNPIVFPSQTVSCLRFRYLSCSQLFENKHRSYLLAHTQKILIYDPLYNSNVLLNQFRVICFCFEHVIESLKDLIIWKTRITLLYRNCLLTLIFSEGNIGNDINIVIV